jgi:hypothetical protein
MAVEMVGPRKKELIETSNERSEYGNIADGIVYAKIHKSDGDQIKLSQRLGEVRGFLVGFMCTSANATHGKADFEFYRMINDVFGLPDVREQGRAGVTMSQLCQKINGRLRRRLKTLDKLASDCQSVGPRQTKSFFGFLDRLRSGVQNFKMGPFKHY